MKRIDQLTINQDLQPFEESKGFRKPENNGSMKDLLSIRFEWYFLMKIHR